jgi:hypothetical protein
MTLMSQPQTSIPGASEIARMVAIVDEALTIMEAEDIDY